MAVAPIAPIETFDLVAPLPRGAQVVIEASAGTGKTYALAGLTSRYVVEADVAVDQILVVTFTRTAAAELRERIRERLVLTARHLAHPDPDETDPLLVHLAACDEPTRGLRLVRAQRAVIDYDTATITTIHGFCQQVLATLGSAARHNPDAVLVQDTSELIAGVASDVLAAASLDGRADLPSLSVLSGHVRTVTNNPGIEVVCGSDEPAEQLLVELVERCATEIRRRLATTSSVTFDDLLTGVRDAVTADAGVRRRVAERFEVALIDEFQDTDPVQWEIFSALFGQPPSTLVLVGDPKQAIYSFRGGDIHTYLRAAEGPGVVRRTLGTNWRSDGAVVEAMNGLCEGLTLGDRDIAYRTVGVDPGHAGRRLRAADGTPLAPLEVRAVVDPALESGRGRSASPAARAAIEEDLAAQVAELLDGTRLTDSGLDRPLVASDVAVLIRAHSEGPPIQRALSRLGVPSIITGGRSVTQTPAADQWRILLAALSRPADVGRARAAVLTWFWGWTAGQLAEASDTQLADVQMRHERWAAALRAEGVGALVSRLRHESELVAGVLSQPGGGRDLTDLEHLSELLHSASAGRSVGAAHLLGLLAALDRDASEEEDPLALNRRVDTDAAAVQIMTVHAAKGLEFGVVCCPSLWNPSALNVTRVLFYDRDREERVLDVAKANGKAKKGPATRNRELATAELIGEHVRLTYVALTRARHRTMVWWASPSGSEKTGLARVLFGADPAAEPTAPVVVPANADCVEHLCSRVAERAPGLIAVEAVPPVRAGDVGPVRSTPAPGAEIDAALEVATLGRALDRRTGRWSFTAITRYVSHDPEDDSLGDRGANDEGAPGAGASEGSADGAAEALARDLVGGPMAPTPDVAPPPTAAATGSVLLGEVGSGPAFGTMVHSVLELVDFDDPDLEARLTEQVAAQAWRSETPPPLESLVAGLLAAVATPLGAAFGHRRLADLSRRDRLDELDFEIPLGRDGLVPTRAIGELVAGALEPSHPLVSWATQLATGRIDVDLGGYLTGSIDLVVRVPGSDGTPRFSVVDYKTNRVSAPGEPIRLEDFDPDHLAVEMARHQYPLQALLYSVALHRYLRWRLPDYDPDRHLGPVGYLFLRGMVGPDTPGADGRPFGVFDWQLPSGLVAGLSQVLDGARVPA